MIGRFRAVKVCRRRGLGRRMITLNWPRQRGCGTQSRSNRAGRYGSRWWRVRSLRWIAACVRRGKQIVACNGERSNDQHADQPNHHGYKDRHDFDQCTITDNRPSRGAGVINDCNRNSPPGKGGIEAGGQQPCTEKVPNLGGFIAPLLWCKDAGDSSEVNTAKSYCQNGRPPQTGKFEIPKHIRKSKLRGAVIEDLKGQ